MTSVQIGNPVKNIMTYLFIVWLLFYVAEILNPNNVMAAWNINLTPYALIPLICAFVVPVVIRTKKDVELLLIIWSIFVIIFTLKRLLAKNHGFSSKTFISCMYWEAHALTLYGRDPLLLLLLRCRKLWVHAAMSAVTFAIAAFFVDSRWKRIYFLLSLFAVFTEWGFRNPFCHGCSYGWYANDNHHS